MKFKKLNFLNLILLISFLFTPFSKVNSLNYDFNLIGSFQEVKNKDPFSLNLNLTKNNIYYNNLRVHPFTAKIKFNKDLFDFQKITCSNGNFQDMSIKNSDDGIIIEFQPSENHLLSFSGDSAEFLKANFVCKSNLSCESYFEVVITDVETQEILLSEATNILLQNENTEDSETNNNQQSTDKTSKNKNSYKPQNNTPSDCKLKSIVPNVGILTPSFKPDIFKYKIEVPQEIREIYFDIIPLSENTNVRVNKHRLGSPGTITYITVTSKNQSKSLSYLIEVKRNIASATPKIKTKQKTPNEAGIENKKEKSKLPKSGLIEHKTKLKGKHRKNCKSKGKNKKDIGDDADEKAEEEYEDENEENSEKPKQQNKTETKELSSNNNKFHWAIIFSVLVLSILIYLYFKRKSQSPNSSDDSKNDVSNFFEK